MYMNFKPGVSLKTIACPMTSEVIRMLGNSFFATFESSHTVFNVSNGIQLKQEFLEMLKWSGKMAPTYHLPFGTDFDLSACSETARKMAVQANVALLEEAQELTAGLVVVHGSWEPVLPENRSRQLIQLKHSLFDLVPELTKRGMRLAIEFLPRSCLGNNIAELMQIVSEFDDILGVCLDVNHLMCNYNSLPDIVYALGAKLFSLHISDYDGIDERHWLPGTSGSVIDWPDFLAALNKIGYNGIFNYELRMDEIPPEHRLQAIEYNYNTFICKKANTI